MNTLRQLDLSRNAGFTIVEVMVVVAITAILAAAVAPSFTSLIDAQRAKSAATDMYISLTRARSEAIKRNANMTVLPKTGSWSNGWEMFDPISGTVIDDHGTLKGITITGPAGGVTYQSSGRLQGGGMLTLCIKGAMDTTSRLVSGRIVQIDPSGRPKVKVELCPT